jgi:ribosome maturation factor RimP
MIGQEQVTGLVNDLVENSNKFLVEVIVQPGNRILVFIDSDTSVTIDDCQALSRQIERHLDRNNEDFDLTVSSAGIDRPLKLLRQYAKNTGRKLTVTTNTGTTLNGILIRTGESGIELEHRDYNRKKEKKKENTVISFAEIKHAKIEVDFGK